MPFDWEGDTRPFWTPGGGQPARVVLRQIDDDTFAVAERFWFRRRMPDGSRVLLDLTPELCTSTDLASIPGFLGWFARRHGRHTPAAIVHDLLITDDPDSLPEGWRVGPEEADLVFREALLDCDVALVKAYVLWAGVTARTRWKRRPGPAIALAVWMVLAVLGSAALTLGLVTFDVPLILLGAVGPFPAAVLWGRQWGAGLVAGLAFWLVLLGSLPAFVAYQAYRAIEWAVVALRLVRRTRTLEELPTVGNAPADPIPTPAPYGKR